MSNSRISGVHMNGSLTSAPSATRPYSAFGWHASQITLVDRTTLVAFTVGAQHFAAPVESVERILRPSMHAPATVQRESTSEPCDDTLSQSIAGARVSPDECARERAGEVTIEYRGRTVPVVELRTLLRRPRFANEDTRVIVFKTQPNWIAAVVDCVSEVMAVEAASIVAPESNHVDISLSVLSGVVKHRGNDVLILDMLKLLSASDSSSQNAAVTVAA